MFPFSLNTTLRKSIKTFTFKLACMRVFVYLCLLNLNSTVYVQIIQCSFTLLYTYVIKRRLFYIGFNGSFDHHTSDYAIFVLHLYMRILHIHMHLLDKLFWQLIFG